MDIFQVLCINTEECDYWIIQLEYEHTEQFYKNYQTVFQSGCTILHSHQQGMRAIVAPHPHQYLVKSVF